VASIDHVQVSLPKSREEILELLDALRG